MARRRPARNVFRQNRGRRRGRGRNVGGDEISRKRKEISDEEVVIRNDHGKLVREEATLRRLQAELAALLARGQSGGGGEQGSMFSALFGEILRLRNEISGCGSNLNNLQARFNESDSKLRALNGEMQTLRGQYDTLRHEKALVDADLQLKIAEIASLNQTIIELKAKIDALNGVIVNLNSIIDSLNTQIGNLQQQKTFLQEQVFVNEVTNTNQLLGVSEVIDASLNRLFSYLRSSNINPDVIYQKVNYRSIEHDKLHNINKTLDVVYYCFYAAFILIMICMGNTQKEKFLIYLIVGLVPIIFPFLFKFGNYLFGLLSSDHHGPKNAFIDINNTLFAYNV